MKKMQYEKSATRTKYNIKAALHKKRQHEESTT